MVLHLENLLRLPETLEGVEVAEVKSARDEARSFCPEATPAERTVFLNRARELAPAVSAEETPGRMALAVVRMNEELFGLDLEGIREFAELRGVTPVPCCPAHILGQMSLRGDLFTLVDLGVVLGLPAAAAGPNRKVVVLNIAGLGVAVPVDEVLDVRNFQPGEVAPVPAAVRPVNSAFLRGTAPFGGQMLSILDLPRIFAQEQLVVNEEPEWPS
jgi:purine-binding chemotaxis protein CheW